MPLVCVLYILSDAQFILAGANTGGGLRVGYKDGVILQDKVVDLSLASFPQGILTECISPDAGLYQLDGGIMLYMTDRLCIDGCHGFRLGASLFKEFSACLEIFTHFSSF